MKNKYIQLNQDDSLEYFLMNVDFSGFYEIKFNESFIFVVKNNDLYVKFSSINNLNNMKKQILTLLKIDSKLIVNNEFLKLELINSKHDKENKQVSLYNKNIKVAMGWLLGIGVDIMKCPQELSIVREDLLKLNNDFDNLNTKYIKLKNDHDLIKTMNNSLKADHDSLKADHDLIKTMNEINNEKYEYLKKKYDEIIKKLNSK